MFTMAPIGDTPLWKISGFILIRDVHYRSTTACNGPSEEYLHDYGETTAQKKIAASHTQSRATPPHRSFCSTQPMVG